MGTGISLAEVNMSDTNNKNLSSLYNITGFYKPVFNLTLDIQH